ncbi:calycin-like domain-containing protein [Prevotella sp.]|uniref:calycin-like domain-containing protein n=1 Tax=Prevotella sp. TaxID=59823 RepID=UPI004027DE28
MKKILSLLSFLMLAVVAMAADLTTGVTFKGTWGDKLGDYPTAEGEMTVTKVDEGLKFEVKSNGFNGYAFPAYTLVYKSEVAADGSFNTGDYFIGEITGDPTMDGLPVANLYWQQIKGTVTNESIDLYIRYMGVNMTELEHITFKGEAVASPDPEPDPEPTVVSTKDFTDTFTMSYIENGELQSSSFKDFPASFVELSDGTFNVEFPEVNHKFAGLLQKYDPATERTYYEGTYTENDGMQVYNFDVTAYLYTKDDVEHIYFIAKSDNADQLTYAYGSDPFAEPVVEDVVLKENYQADGTGFSFTTPIDWETQKFQAVLDVTGCSTSAVEDIFGLGPDVSSFANNIHVYSEQNSTYKAYYQCSNGNNNTTVNIADKQNVTIEVSKADGLTVDGNVIIPAEKLEGFFDLTEVMFGSLENSQFTNALYKSIKLINLNKKEEPVFVTYTAPAMYTYASMDEETPGAKRFVEAQEIQLSDNGDGTYTVIIKNLGDCEGDPAGDVQFTATATEAEDGTISLTADTQVELGGYYEGSGEYAVKFNGTLNGEDLTATYDIDIPSGAAHAEFGNGVTNGINTVNNTNNTITSIYTVGGAKVNSLQKGVNIVRLANGKTVKVIK